ncbi:serine hydrolase domain-containing protein [Paenarthrobacter nicotinovorans]|uniref:serine hydrolase domain-containing protein n=1 Tax=Paenarthrobacter nicotinovorans TaxID=29320 RepID=UPI0009A731B4|nr:serine hydrolase domain-containing protein [Paenarthrobacter nicotinovorans]MDI2022222.1 D-aminopeptidase [Paenarthrobacter nicotinovorans]SKB31742.1 D-alanyl-D-alanine carboxypeptidase [Arthrobacter sp. 31Cvi3.1E]
MTRNMQVSVRAATAAAVIAAVAATVSCSSGPPVSPASSTAASAPASTASPTSAPTALQRFDSEGLRADFERTAKEVLVPGAMVLLETPEGTLTASYGTGTRGAERPVSMADHIRVGSVTKTWTTTVILQLVQEGKLALGDPVSKYRPDVPNGDGITLEQLLTMRSGLFNYTETLELNSAMDKEPRREWKPEELLALGFAHPPYFAPGQGFHYSNTNTVLLGLIAEKVAGKPLGDLFKERIFQPLGLKGTVFPDISSNSIPEPHPQGYFYGDNVLTMTNPALPEDMQKEAAAGTLAPNDVTDVNPSWAWAAGSGISTTTDLKILGEALVNGKLLDAGLQQQRLDSVIPTNPENPDRASYGWGIAKFGKLYGHTGELPGFNTFMGSDPANGVTLVVWTNLAPAADGRDPAVTIARSLIGKVYQAGS